MCVCFFPLIVCWKWRPGYYLVRTPVATQIYWCEHLWTQTNRNMKRVFFPVQRVQEFEFMIWKHWFPRKRDVFSFFFFCLFESGKFKGSNLMWNSVKSLFGMFSWRKAKTCLGGIFDLCSCKCTLKYLSVPPTPTPHKDMVVITTKHFF